MVKAWTALHGQRLKSSISGVWLKNENKIQNLEAKNQLFCD